MKLTRSGLTSDEPAPVARGVREHERMRAADREIIARRRQDAGLGRRRWRGRQPRGLASATGGDEGEDDEQACARHIVEVVGYTRRVVITAAAA
jgi:hypothetical protein